MSLTTNIHRVRHLLVELDQETLYAPETILAIAVKSQRHIMNVNDCLKILKLKTTYLGEPQGYVQYKGTPLLAWPGKTWITLTIQYEFASIIKIFNVLETDQTYSLWDLTSKANVLEPRLRPFVARIVLLISDGRSSYKGSQWQTMASEMLIPSLVNIRLELFFSEKWC